MLKPRAGVVILQTNSVSDDWITLWILIPFVLLVVNNSTVVSGSPFGSWRTSTEDMEFPVIFALRIPLSIFCPEPVLTITRFGASVKFLPPLVTVTIPIVLESFNVTIAGIFAFGCRVLSDEYSNPSLIILTLLVLPTEFDCASKLAPDAVVLEDPT